MLVQTSLKSHILDAQKEAMKEENLEDEAFLGANKMYKDVKEYYWWLGMKKYIALTTRGHDSIWVVVDRLMKFAHFLPIRKDYNMDKLAQTDGQSERMIHTMEDMLRACVINFGVQTSLKSHILDAQKEAMKEENLEDEAFLGADHKLEMRSNEVGYFNGKAWIPKVNNLRKVVMDKSHKSRYSIHPEANKMYKDVKEYYWWLAIKNSSAEIETNHDGLYDKFAQDDKRA
uniref:Putative reverse transcriptase domain-containing protein n=1 Tax=Tanacetum cinerariifolium TaxID=118510 RepID=A0A6L2P4I8_TANCI|nr:putative reverse transcriptase domain-containing protein [Tanacetum cinerariifolium]